MILSVLKRLNKINKLYIYSLLLISIIIFSVQSNFWWAPILGYFFLVIVAGYFQRLEGESFFWGRNFFKGFLIAFIAITGIFLIELSGGFISVGKSNYSFSEIIIGGIIVQTFVAFGEELSFRAYFLPRLLKYGVWKGIIFSSVLFSLFHIPALLEFNINENIFIMLTTIFFIQVLLSLLYLKDGLKITFGFHFSWNFFQYHIFSLRDGFEGILNVQTNDTAITGGVFGPEAGLLGLAFFSIAVGVALLLSKNM